MAKKYIGELVSENINNLQLK